MTSTMVDAPSVHPATPVNGSGRSEKAARIDRLADFLEPIIQMQLQPQRVHAELVVLALIPGDRVLLLVGIVFSSPRSPAQSRSFPRSLFNCTTISPRA